MFMKLALKVVMQTDGDFLDVILLYLMELGLSSSGSNILLHIGLGEMLYKITITCYVLSLFY
jgi:hypothetical protein